MNSSFSLKGSLVISLNDKVVREIDNTVVDIGKDWAASLLGGGSPDLVSHMELGLGSTAVTAVDTDLDTIHGDDTRIAITSTTVTDNAITYACTWAAGENTGAITEAGLFNHLTTDTTTMIARTVFAAINKGALDTMTISWTITVS